MSIITDPKIAPHDRGSVEHRLARFLETPFLARVVPHLAPETLHQLIHLRGLEASGELLTSATPAQLTSLLDLDLWHHAQPGRDDEFDVERFGEWLEVLAETGESIAARTVAALDQHLVILGLSRYLRVFDPGTFEPTAATDDEPSNHDEMMSSETSRNVLECRVGGYLVRARRTDAWDAIVALLVTLETDHNDDFHSIMQGCRALSNSKPEVDGLDDLRMAPEQHGHDVSIEREQRRSRRGYATPAEARAFLQMARHRKPSARTSDASPPMPVVVNPIVAAYFRAIDEDAGTIDGPFAAAPELAPHDDTADASASQHDDSPTSIDAVIELLTEAGVMPVRPRALLAAADEDPRAAQLPLLKQLMEQARHGDEAAYFARHRELAFLANTLLAGCSVQSRPFTPQEAADAAACVCNLGLESGPAPDLITAFEVGWSRLHQDVSLFAADRLLSTLAHLDAIDADTRTGLRALKRTLAKQRKAGTPWLARDAAEVLSTLDMTAWVGVLGVLDECPILPAALTAVLERRTTTVSPTAFEFISTSAQIEDIRVFMGMLPVALAG